MYKLLYYDDISIVFNIEKKNYQLCNFYFAYSYKQIIDAFKIRA